MRTGYFTLGTSRVVAAMTSMIVTADAHSADARSVCFSAQKWTTRSGAPVQISVASLMAKCAHKSKGKSAFRHTHRGGVRRA